MTTLGASFPEEWFARRTYHHSQFADLDRLVHAKRTRGLRVSVCLPTRNEAGTVGTVIRSIREQLVERRPLVDEIAVVDSMSTDGTVEAARAAGATVYQDRDIAPEFEPFGGKGDALWKSLFVLSGDLIVFVDADIRNFDPHFVYGLLGPLLVDESLGYVKAIYERPIASEGEGLAASGGGRVTELVARPLINMFFPELAGFVQPLSGEYAGSREILESVPFFTGYGVEFGLLVDVLERAGLESMAQVDLDVRIHRNQTVPELSRMGFSVLQAAFHRLRSIGRVDLRGDVERLFHQFALGPEGYEPHASLIEVRERPPAASVPSYRTRMRQEAGGS
ncbi:MAG: glucosyl-3-phosphoglycerate synthase [Actinomycetota bacterium]